MDPYEENVDSLVDHTEEVTASQAAVPEVLKDADVLLIETVAAYPALYDKQVKEYHASDIRQNCWGMVAAVTNTSAAYCQKRWSQLRDSFTAEKRRRDTEQRSGSGATKRKGFALYNDMQFLQKHVKQKKTFTNIPPPPVKTSSAVGLQQSNVHPSAQLGPVRRFPGSTSIMTCLDDMLQSDIPPEPTFDTELELLSSLPPTPESDCSTPPAISSMLTPPLERNATTSKLLPSTYPLFPRASMSNSEALATRQEVASSNISERSSTFSKVTCTETSVKSGSNLPALSSPPPPPPPPPRTPTPRSTLASPISPYSPYSDFSYSFSPDEVSDNATTRSSATPTSCYTKDLRKGKKVDPVEKSFLSLSSVIQDHFAQKPVAKPPQISAETGNATDSKSEDAFGSLIAMELKKMDEETKKQKKAKIIQILYE